MATPQKIPVVTPATPAGQKPEPVKLESVKIPAGPYGRLVAYCKPRGLKINFTVCQAIEAYLERQEAAGV